MSAHTPDLLCDGVLSTFSGPAPSVVEETPCAETERDRAPGNPALSRAWRSPARPQRLPSPMPLLHVALQPLVWRAGYCLSAG